MCWESGRHLDAYFFNCVRKVEEFHVRDVCRLRLKLASPVTRHIMMVKLGHTWGFPDFVLFEQPSSVAHSWMDVNPVAHQSHIFLKMKLLPAVCSGIGQQRDMTLLLKLRG